MFEIKFADIGEGLTEGKVTEVMVKVGDKVKMGDNLFHVETDKVNSEIPSPRDGVISKILIAPGQEIKVGEIVIVLDDNSGTTAEPKAEEENASVVGSTPVSNEVLKRNIETPTIKKTNKVILASPLARKLAAKKGIILEEVVASSATGRISVADIENFKPNVNVEPAKETVSVIQKVVEPVKAGKPGPDFNNPKIEVPNFEEPLTFESKAMNGIRKATVKQMTLSHTQNAAFTGMRSIDITNLVDLRNQLKTVAEQQNVKLTYLAFITKAVAKSLEAMPNLNSRIDLENNSIQFMKNINIGIAVDTPEGLMVPVIKGANKLSVFQIAVKINELANKTKTKKLSLNEMRDGTFTISNFGTVGLDFATPLINSPESAILGIGGMAKTPMYIGDEVQPRWVMPFSATADHRIIDGADAGRFLLKIQEYLQNPLTLLV